MGYLDPVAYVLNIDKHTYTYSPDMFLLFHTLGNELMCYIIFFNFIQLQCKTVNASYTDIHNVFDLNIVL